MEFINNIFLFIGYLGTGIAVIRAVWVFLLSNTEWVSNVAITELSKDDPAIKGPLGDSIYPVYYDIDSSDNSQRFLIRPNNVIVRKMKLVKIKYGNGYEEIGQDTVKEFVDVSPFRPIVIKIELPELIPVYSLIWYGDYGIKSVYLFSMNGRDGNYNRFGFKCEYGFWQKIRKVFGFK